MRFFFPPKEVQTIGGKTVLSSMFGSGPVRTCAYMHQWELEAYYWAWQGPLELPVVAFCIILSFLRSELACICIYTSSLVTKQNLFPK